MRQIFSAIFLLDIALLATGCEENVVSPRANPPANLVLRIDRPPLQPGEQQYGSVVVFGWSAEGGRVPSFTRYLSTAVLDTTGAYNPSFDIVRDLNENPQRYDSLWSDWKPYGPQGDSSRMAVIGKDKPLVLGRHYVFAVQARDENGAMTDTFISNINVRRYKVKSSSGPILRIFEPYIVGFRFLGTNMYPIERELPPGVPLEFRWYADASDYRGEIVGYRYGWDIENVAAWEAPFRSDLTNASRVSFSAGIHTLFVEAMDMAGAHVLGRVTIRVSRWPMDRNLLFVDDFAGASWSFPDYSFPSESQDKEFWNAICSRAEGFDHGQDTYDCGASGGQPPSPSTIGRYKNIIWNYSSGSVAWSSIVRFVPESQVGVGTQRINYLPIFLLLGGHIWTLGHSDRGGGLAATLLSTPKSFPRNIECELLEDMPSCSGSRIGANTMAYRDYCVSVLDKVDATFRQDADMPPRARDRVDVLVGALLDKSDPLSLYAPALPEHLTLWEEATKPGRRFDPADSLGPGGVTFVEAYDPAYWMNAKGLVSQLCFRPIYRMQAKDPSSALDGCAVAIWITKYSHVTPDVASGAAIAAPSVHFGFPLWYFRRSAVDSIADAIFARWGIARMR